MYCRGCSYLLIGLYENRCPECGRAFDPAIPRTYRTHPHREWLGNLCRILLLAAIVILVVLLTGGSWLHWHLNAEQSAMARIRSVDGAFLTKPLAGKRMSQWFSKINLQLETVDVLDLQSSRFDFERLGPGTDLEQLKRFANLRILYVTNEPLTDAGLAHVKRLSRLQKLFLSFTQITDAGLKYLEGLSELEALFLHGTQVSDQGLVHLVGLDSLTDLFLYETDVTDSGLHVLKNMKSLRRLDVRRTRVTEAGVRDFKEALPNIEVLGP